MLILLWNFFKTAGTLKLPQFIDDFPAHRIATLPTTLGAGVGVGTRSPDAWTVVTSSGFTACVQGDPVSSNARCDSVAPCLVS